MEPLNDRELNQLLSEWKAPPTPKSLRSPLDRRPRSAWHWLFAGSIRIPVPVAALTLSLVALLAFLAYSSLSGPFEKPRPRVVEVTKETGPAPEPEPKPEPDQPAPARVQPPVPNDTPPAVVPRIEQAASLSGFQTVEVLEPRIVRRPQ